MALNSNDRSGIVSALVDAASRAKLVREKVAQQASAQAAGTAQPAAPAPSTGTASTPSQRQP